MNLNPPIGSMSSSRTPSPILSKLAIALLLTALFSSASSAADLSPAVSSWLAAQPQLRTWSADFVQTRALKSLTQPLTAPGHVWFAAPNRFRWELGSPPQTIAVRARSALMIFYPRLKRVELFPLTGNQSGPWRDALALLEAGFPRSESELQNQYTILSQTVTGQTCEIALEPKSASARRMIPEIRIDFDVQNYSLLGTQLKFADGSTMRNDFKHQVLNPQMDDTLFQPEIPTDYKVVEPLKK
jgi:outer membrane lipoprotein-sorting protein